MVRVSKVLRKDSLSGSSLAAKECETASSSEVKLAGSRLDLPSTICSGENPFCRVREFLAWKQAIKMRSKSWMVSMGLSKSNLVSILLMIWPCLSILPRCQASVDISGWMEWSRIISFHSWDMNSPAGSVYIWSGSPAHEDQNSDHVSMTRSGLRVSHLRPRWNKEASSIQWNTWTLKPRTPDQ